MQKQNLVDQLVSKLRSSACIAAQASAAAAEIAREGATPQEKREDARVALEFGSLARGQGHRLEKARAELAVLETFRPAPLPAGGRIAIGAVVEIEDEDSGEGRTFFLAPVGAGVELTMPEGDGFLSVVTPGSPIGRAVLGRRRGDSVEVSVEGETRYWKVAWVE
ncbi:MAG TPA: GreA/GreB family elongation factor [Polyangia bacterium]